MSSMELAIDDVSLPTHATIQLGCRFSHETFFAPWDSQPYLSLKLLKTEYAVYPPTLNWRIPFSDSGPHAKHNYSGGQGGGNAENPGCLCDCNVSRRCNPQGDVPQETASHCHRNVRCLLDPYGLWNLQTCIFIIFQGNRTVQWKSVVGFSLWASRVTCA